MTLEDVFRDLAALAGAGGIGGAATFLLTLRQRRRLMAARAGDVEATGQARIMDAAGRIVEQQAELVPGLLERIAKLEEREETRNAELRAVREHAEQAALELAAVVAELDRVYRFADEAARWMQNALRLVQELGAEIPPPPPTPERRPVAVAAGNTRGQTR